MLSNSGSGIAVRSSNHLLQPEKGELRNRKLHVSGKQDLGFVAASQEFWVEVREHSPDLLQQLLAGSEGSGPQLQASGSGISHDPIAGLGRAALQNQLNHQPDGMPVRRGHGDQSAGSGHVAL
jgi:hypothetical protein